MTSGVPATPSARSQQQVDAERGRADDEAWYCGPDRDPAGLTKCCSFRRRALCSDYGDDAYSRRRWYQAVTGTCTASGGDGATINLSPTTATTRGERHGVLHRAQASRFVKPEHRHRSEQDSACSAPTVWVAVTAFGNCRDLRRSQPAGSELQSLIEIESTIEGPPRAAFFTIGKPTGISLPAPELSGARRAAIQRAGRSGRSRTSRRGLAFGAYLIESGRVELSSGDSGRPLVLGELGPRHAARQRLAVIDSSPRSATARTDRLQPERLPSRQRHLVERLALPDSRSRTP